jgi:hypothetical protein
MRIGIPGRVQRHPDFHPRAAVARLLPAAVAARDERPLAYADQAQRAGSHRRRVKALSVIL